MGLPVQQCLTVTKVRSASSPPGASVYQVTLHSGLIRYECVDTMFLIFVPRVLHWLLGYSC